MQHSNQQYPSTNGQPDESAENQQTLPRQVSRPDEVITDEQGNVLKEQEPQPEVSTEPPKQASRPDEVITDEDNNVLNSEEPTIVTSTDDEKEKGFKEGMKDDSIIEGDSDSEPVFPSEEG